MTTYYFDSAVASGGAGTLLSPYAYSFSKLASLAAGSTVVFRGSGTLASPKVYSGGGILTAKNFIIQNQSNEHVRLQDTSRATAFEFRQWTAGQVAVQGTGSIRFGPTLTNNPVADSDWHNAALKLAGCSGMTLDGGASKRLIFNSNGDFGLWLTNYGATGTASVTVRYCEATNNGSGVYVSNSGYGTSRGPTGPGIVLEYIDSHDNKRMLDARGVGGDVGAQGFGFERVWGTSGNRLEFRYNRMWNNYAPSPDYGEDGVGFETYASGYLNLHHNTVWDCAGWYESGTDGSSPLSAFLVIHHNLFYGRSNGLVATSGSPGILLRDFSDSTFDNNTLDLGPNGSNAYVLMLYDDAGTYGGAIDRVKIRNNILYQRNAKVVYFVNNLPTGLAAPVIDYNLIRRSDASSTLADYKGQTPINRTFAQWQAHGFDVNGQNAAPTWVDVATRDYDLSPGSNGIDDGVVIAGITDGFGGAAPDVGAFEVGGVTPPPDPEAPEPPPTPPTPVDPPVPPAPVVAEGIGPHRHDSVERHRHVPGVTAGYVLTAVGDGTVEWAAGGSGGGGIPATILDAKGDLIAASAADTAARLAVGANDTILMADSGQATGLKWVASQTPSTQAFSDAAAEGTADTYARGDHKHGMPASGGAGGGLTLLSDTSLVAAAATIEIGGIASTYLDLLIIAVLKTTVAARNEACYIRVGGGAIDTGANYDWVGWQNGSVGNNSSVGAASAAGVYIGPVSGDTSTSTVWSMHRVEIGLYAVSTNRRTFHAQSSHHDNDNREAYVGGGSWRNTANAIARILIRTGGASNFKVGSRVMVYGRS